MGAGALPKERPPPRRPILQVEAAGIPAGPVSRLKRPASLPAEVRAKRASISLLDPRPMEGIWHNRTAYGEARRRGERVCLEDFAERELVTLSTLPCWQGLTPEEIRERIAYLLYSIERQPGSPIRRYAQGCRSWKHARHLRSRPPRRMGTR